MKQLKTRAVIRVAGPEARSFLQGIITQDIAAQAADGVLFSAILTPQGKILFDFLIHQSGDEFLLDVHNSSSEALAKRLSLYRLRAKVDIQPRPELNILIGDGSADPRHPGLPRRMVGGLPADAGDDDYDRLRLKLGVPEFGRDFAGDEMFLLDVNYDVLSAVSYKKGCFVGQEVTSRMKRKGDVRRRTLKARFQEAAADKGTRVTAGDSDLGEILSSRETSALALVRLDRLQAAQGSGAEIVAAGAPLQLLFPAYLDHG